MILLQRQVIDGIDTVEGLRQALQNAIELEHSTIPAYLYALYSIKPGANVEIQGLIESVVMEEMLHMALACNILNAIGGSPVIDEPGFIPTYPGPLPGSVQADLQVSLQPFSPDLVKVFMKIEEPEDPIEFRVQLLAASGPLTIGQFYAAIKAQIAELGPDVFTGSADRQLVHGFPAAELFAVTDVESAGRAIDLIVQQGEGTSTSPLDPQHELAHYYRFAEISHGARLVPDSTDPNGYAYAGDPIPFDPDGVWPVVSDPTLSPYPPGSAAAHANTTFNYTYTGLLGTLHDTFNGNDRLRAAIGLMESLKEQALAMASIELGGPDGRTAGPSFEYRPVND
jgi:rubrerythrin